MKSKTKRLRPNDLIVVFAVQRESIQSWVRKIQRNLDPLAVGVVYVSERSDGKLAIVDGQHRVLALIEAGLGDQPIHCLVYEGLTLSEEADQFLKLNDRRSVNAVDKFRVGVTAGLEDCVGVAEILDDLHLQIVGEPSRNGNAPIGCPTAMLGIYNRNGEREGPQALRCALKTAITAFGTDGAALDGKVVGGLGEIFLSNGWVESKALAERLAKFPGGAAGLIGKARGRYEFDRSSLSKCVAKVAADAYNQRRTKNRIEVG